MPLKSILDNEVNIRTMRKHVEDGLTDKEIAEKYFVSPNTIYRFRKKHGLNKHRDRSIRDVDTYYRMKGCGLTDEQVAYIWNITRRTLYQWKSDNQLEGIAIQVGEEEYGGERRRRLISRKPKESCKI